MQGPSGALMLAAVTLAVNSVTSIAMQGGARRPRTRRGELAVNSVTSIAMQELQIT